VLEPPKTGGQGQRKTEDEEGVKVAEAAEAAVSKPAEEKTEKEETGDKRIEREIAEMQTADKVPSPPIMPTKLPSSLTAVCSLPFAISSSTQPISSFTSRSSGL